MGGRIGMKYSYHNILSNPLDYYESHPLSLPKGYRKLD